MYQTTQGRRKHDMGEHCSSLVRLTPGNTELLSSHVTWSAFNTMLRVYKHYEASVWREVSVFFIVLTWRAL